ncbi:AfsR/SARP family transcriptional regulator [Actinoplanes sp. ATCC 53533]|uniref:AfsR/SARP family transcriptional regulator n=1 Tax=Actinoplanes sp. ATCC 53533 TaxID=1288362 RepID=UPI0021068617|nr:AfsR/SARP family transcriptional regulator [Actinoplanes sp. ATCC 53533]
MGGRSVTNRFKILGPLEVIGSAGPIAPLAPRQRTILAVLLLEANRIVSVNRLADTLWNDAPPSTARSQVLICVSGLRRALADAGLGDPVVTRSPGYLLRVADGELDLQTFDHLIGVGRAAADDGRLTDALTAYDAANALWRGDPLSDVASRIVRSAGVALAERRLVLDENTIQARLDLGDHQEVIGDLMRMVAQHPLRERLCGQLMLALYRAGRQAEALETYRTVRRTFATELGLEPGEDLRELERQILTGEAVLHPMTPIGAGPVAVDAEVTPHMLPAAVADFTGRDKAMAEMRDVLANRPAPTGPPRGIGIVALAGRAGAGKTSLAVHAAHELADEFPDGQLYVTLGGAEGRGVPTGQVLARFLRALGVNGDDIPAGDEERAELYRLRLGDRRVLVVLDDAGDEEQVRSLLPGGPRCAVIVTSRPRLASLPGARLIDVDVLTSTEGTDLLSAVIGSSRVYDDLSSSLDLIRVCDGLPLAVRIVASRLAARPHWTTAQLLDRLAEPRRRLAELAYAGWDVRAGLAADVAALEPVARRLLRRLSIVPAADFGDWVAGPLLDEPDADARDVLETLVDRQLVAAVRLSGRPARYRLPGLVAVYARDLLAGHETPADLAAARRRTLAAWLRLAVEAARRGRGPVPAVSVTMAPEPGNGWVDRVLMTGATAWFDAERHGLIAAVRQAAGTGERRLGQALAAAAAALSEAAGTRGDWREFSAVPVAGDGDGEAPMRDQYRRDRRPCESAAAI